MLTFYEASGWQLLPTSDIAINTVGIETHVAVGAIDKFLVVTRTSAAVTPVPVTFRIKVLRVAKAVSHS